MRNPLLVAIPSRHVTGAIMELLCAAGWEWDPPAERQFSFLTRDGSLRVCLLRSHDIPRAVSDGNFDIGFVQGSVIEEEGGHSLVVRGLPMAQGGMVVGVREGSAIRSAADLAGSRMATRNPRLAARYLLEKCVDCPLLPVGGSPEVYVAAGIAAAVLAYWKTGATFRANGLRVLDQVCASELKVLVSARANETDQFLARLDRCVASGPIPERWRSA